MAKRPAAETAAKKPPTGAGLIANLRETLAASAAELAKRFDDNELVDTLVRERALAVDAVLTEAWQCELGDLAEDLALIAVGGYGRGELHPQSDVDVMVLLPDEPPTGWEDAAGRFVTLLWDIGIEPGHSARTVADCVRESTENITVTTTLMESRRLAGPDELFQQMRLATGPESVWPAGEFFEAKRREQIQRHGRYHDTAYNLEPNIKGNPGGLRDIQMIGWVAKRHFGVKTLHELVDHGFLTEAEHTSLMRGQSFLWKIRFALHVLTNRREDRLLFDYQTKLAKQFGYEDSSYTLAVEQMMQRYYRTVMELNRLNEMLLQLFEEAILMDPSAEPRPINNRFQVRNEFLEVTNKDLFQQNPSALLELFLIMQENPDLHGVSAETIRLVRGHRELIDDEFRQSPRNHRLFMRIISAPVGVTHELGRMNRYGVLGRYVPAFGRITGRMQYDLFHAYTVDAHTLFVVSNLRRLALKKYDHEFPHLSRIMQALEKPEIAYLAALFHDIAKGRGGDHSELGAVEAEAFCLEQGLSRYESRVVAWLVRHHLLLSITAQKKDIGDPEVIQEFARTVGDQLHLDYLYLLTVADIRATNPNLWNSWKASLFESLYEETRAALRRGPEKPIDKDELILATQSVARSLLAADSVSDNSVGSAWAALSDEYFMRHSAEEVAWHTSLLIRHGRKNITFAKPLVAVREQTDAGSTAIVICAPQRADTFARATAVLAELGLNVLEARITAAGDGLSLDTYFVLEDSGDMITEPERLASIRQSLLQALTQSSGPGTVSRKRSRRARMFATETRVSCSTDAANSRTIVELITGDRPGLLSIVGRTFLNAGARVSAARIMTVGERAEDVFYVTGDDSAPLSASSCERLATGLESALGGSE